jgi:hypothetical protein
MDKLDGNQREGDKLYIESAWWELQITRVAGDSRAGKPRGGVKVERFSETMEGRSQHGARMEGTYVQGQIIRSACLQGTGVKGWDKN